MSDQSILHHITELVDEERGLLASAESEEQKRARLKLVTEQLDQCWDLLRQRRAKREFGEDPDAARVRDVGTVEGYEG